MSESTAIQHFSLTDRTVEQLTTDIMAGVLGSDDNLPSARLLSDRYGVSVLVIREALAQLQAQGLLDKRQGRRTKVIHPDHTAISAVLRFTAQLDDVGVGELQDCRAGLEVKAAQLAARSDRADKSELLEPILDTMSRAKSRREFNEYDLALHMAIAELSGNRPIQIVLAALRDVIREALEVTYSQVESRKGAQGISDALALHARIVRAILDGDSAAAIAAMDEHFRYWHDTGHPDPGTPAPGA